MAAATSGEAPNEPKRRREERRGEKRREEKCGWSVQCSAVQCAEQEEEEEEKEEEEGVSAATERERESDEEKRGLRRGRVGGAATWGTRRPERKKLAGEKGDED